MDPTVLVNIAEERLGQPHDHRIRVVGPTPAKRGLHREEQSVLKFCGWRVGIGSNAISGKMIRVAWVYLTTEGQFVGAVDVYENPKVLDVEDGTSIELDDTEAMFAECDPTFRKLNDWMVEAGHMEEGPTHEDDAVTEALKQTNDFVRACRKG
jgi:hypothetical protein